MKPKYDERIHQNLYNVASCGDTGRRIDEFVSQGANVNFVDDRGYSTLMTACRWGHYDAAKRLIEYGADVNYYSEVLDSTVLMEAAKKCLKLLLDHGADVNGANKRGQTVLHRHFFATFPDHDVFNILVKYGANIEYQDDRGRSLYDMAKGISGKMKDYDKLMAQYENMLLTNSIDMVDNQSDGLQF